MKYEIEKLSDLEIIKVTIDGTLNPSERRIIHSKCISELKISGYYRLLFDIRKTIVSPHFTADDCIDMANYMKTFESQKKTTKLALLNTDRKTPHKTFTVFANIITDIDTRHFINYDEAIEWLSQE